MQEFSAEAKGALDSSRTALESPMPTVRLWRMFGDEIVPCDYSEIVPRGWGCAEAASASCTLPWSLTVRTGMPYWSACAACRVAVHAAPACPTAPCLSPSLHCFRLQAPTASHCTFHCPAGVHYSPARGSPAPAQRRAAGWAGLQWRGHRGGKLTDLLIAELDCRHACR